MQKIIKLNSINNFAVISDVHLQDPNSKLCKLFVAKINALENIDALFLLGDIFDFIASKSAFFLKMWAPVFEAFKNLKNRGIAVYFIEGNHDFGFHHFKTSFLNECFTLYGDYIIELHHEKLGIVHLRHGDDLVCKKNYLKFRALVKGKAFQLLTLVLLPGWFMNFLFSRYAKLSRKKGAYRPLEDNFLNICLNNTVKLYPYIHVLIMGHIHVLKNFKLENSGVHVLIGPDWLSCPNILIYKEKIGLMRV